MVTCPRAERREAADFIISTTVTVYCRVMESSSAVKQLAVESDFSGALWYN